MKGIHLTLLLLFYLFTQGLLAQNFVRVTDPANPLSETNLLDYWTGATWVDIDNDDDLDLFLTNRQPGIVPKTNKLYLNVSNTFMPIDTGALVTDAGYWFGCSWGDYDNDGDLDVHVAGLPSRLYRNEGTGYFVEITSGTIASSTHAGIGTAWGDFNRDGYLDLLTIWPNWLPGPPIAGAPGAPHLMINSGPPDYTFTRLQNTPITGPANDTYLHPTLADYDDDGDLDVFLGMGSGAPKPDLLYRNLLVEEGTLDFEKMEDDPLATSLVEGNQWSWQDIDNDGDLDGFLTNWATTSANNTTVPAHNSLYRNDCGSFVSITDGVIVTDEDMSSTSSWGDYDNDGDLDCVVVTDSTHFLKYYENDGQGHFQVQNAGELGTLDFHQSGASNGDFDGDGDLDLFIPGPGPHQAFLRNDLDNGHHWVRFKLIGTESNHAAIGAKLFLKATINGQAVWQRRDISASSTFFGHNSLWPHFGLGDAGAIDSLRIEWPSGNVDHYEFMQVDEFYTLTEGDGVIPTAIQKIEGIVEEVQIYPNPNNGNFTLEFELAKTSAITIEVIDSTSGRIVWRKPEKTIMAGSVKESLQLKEILASGTYLIAIGQSADRQLIYEFIIR